MDTPAHHCPSYPCPICHPPGLYQVVPVQLPPQGCICPPTSEQTCKNPICPRGGSLPPAIT